MIWPVVIWWSSYYHTDDGDDDDEGDDGDDGNHDDDDDDGDENHDHNDHVHDGLDLDKDGEGSIIVDSRNAFMGIWSSN